MPPVPRPTRAQLLVLALLLVALALPQLAIVAHSEGTHCDGGFYMDVAMYVRDGRGLVSDVSLYHAGVPSFPHATPIYPLWPLLLGHLGRVVDIVALGHWLPFGFWLLSLVGAWLFGRALFPGPVLARWPALDFGHLLVFLLGTQREYSRFTAWPYTEGLAFALLTFALWRLLRMEGRWRDMAELGVWLLLLCLTRSQLFIVPMGLACGMGVVGLLGGSDGRRRALRAGAALAVVVAGLAVWWQQSSTFVLDASPLTLLRFDQAQVSDVLPPIDIMKDTDGPVDFVLDRLGGVLVAWHLGFAGWEESYARGFFLAHWALPVALVVGAVALVRGRLGDALAALRRPQALAVATIVFVGLGALASIHLPHKEAFGEWYFHRRHAIICVVPFFLCFGWLLRRPGLLPRAVAGLLLLGQLGFHAESLYWRLGRLGKPNFEAARYASLATWLQDQASEDEPLVVALAAFSPPYVAWQTDHVGYHWFYERTSLDTLDTMFGALDTDLLVYRRSVTRGWAFRSDPDEFQRRFWFVGVTPTRERVYRWIPPSLRKPSEPDE